MAAADDDDGPDFPTLPKSPKKNLPDQIKPVSLFKRAANVANSEAFQIGDLASDTRGPISNQRDVEKQLSNEELRRQDVENKAFSKVRQMRSRPYTLTGGKR